MVFRRCCRRLVCCAGLLTKLGAHLLNLRGLFFHCCREAHQQLAQFTIKTNLKQAEEFEDNHDNDNYSDFRVTSRRTFAHYLVRVEH